MDICVTVVSSHISEHDIQKSDVANFQSGQNVSKYVCEGTHVVLFYSFYLSLHRVGLDVLVCACVKEHHHQCHLIFSA